MNPLFVTALRYGLVTPEHISLYTVYVTNKVPLLLPLTVKFMIKTPKRTEHLKSLKVFFVVVVVVVVFFLVCTRKKMITFQDFRGSVET